MGNLVCIHNGPPCAQSVGVQGSGFQGFGFRVQGSGFGVQGSGFRASGLAFKVQEAALPGEQTVLGCVLCRLQSLTQGFLLQYLDTYKLPRRKEHSHTTAKPAAQENSHIAAP